MPCQVCQFIWSCQHRRSCPLTVSDLWRHYGGGVKKSSSKEGLHEKYWINAANPSDYDVLGSQRRWTSSQVCISEGRRKKTGCWEGVALWVNSLKTLTTEAAETLLSFFLLCLGQRLEDFLSDEVRLRDFASLFPTFLLTTSLCLDPNVAWMFTCRKTVSLSCTLVVKVHGVGWRGSRLWKRCESTQQWGITLHFFRFRRFGIVILRVLPTEHGCWQAPSLE